jgi:uncharacterized protein YfiM (DUF2279 family)
MASRDDAAAIAFEVGSHALESQEAELSGLHARASFLLAAAGIATGTVLGTSPGTLSHAGLASVVCFAATAGAAIWILLPRRKAWTFTASGATVIEQAKTHADWSKTELLEWLANAYHASYVANRKRLEWQYRILSAGCVTLGLAIVAAIIHLAP